jgi:DNA end-binding protein Ku
VDPVYYEHTYWLAADGYAAATAYRLLLAAMEDAQRVGIGSVVMRNKQYLAAIRPLDGALAMSTMRCADEVVPQREISGIPSARAKTDAKQRRLASQIIDSLASDWQPDRYHDTFTEELRDLIERKAKGETVTAPPAAETPSANVVDLMAALQASLDRGRPGRGRARRSPRKATRAATSSKSSKRAKSAKSA